MKFIWHGKRWDDKGNIGRCNEMFYSYDGALKYYKKRRKHGNETQDETFARKVVQARVLLHLILQSG